jgi:hypothetical protein
MGTLDHRLTKACHYKDSTILETRVTPLKIVTMPRLELMAAVVLSKISKIIRVEMRQQCDRFPDCTGV